MSWLVLSYLLTVGIAPQQQDVLVRDVTFIVGQQYPVLVTTEVGLGARLFDRIELSASVKTYEVPESLLVFHPVRSDYHVSLTADVTPWLRFGVEHECDHVTVSYPTQMNNWQYEGARTQVYVMLHGTFELR